MHRLIRFLLLLVVTASAHAADGAASTNALTLVLELNDGARIIGTPSLTNLPARAAFGRVDLALALVQSIEFKSDKESALISLRNGDKLQAALTLEALDMQTVFGRVKIPLGLVKKILIRSATTGQSGLVLHYSFDDGGEQIMDKSGLGNHGKVVGARQTPDGKVGGGMIFNGRSSVQVPHSDSLVSMQKTREFSCAVWIKPRALARDFPVLVSKGGNEQPKAFDGYEFTLNATGDNDLFFCSGPYHAYTQNAGGRWINKHLQEWIHVAFVQNIAQGSARFYVNGEPTSDEAENGSIKGINFDVPNDLTIGGLDPGANRNRVGFDGVMDELMIFNRALSADEIRQLFQSGK